MELAKCNIMFVNIFISLHLILFIIIKTCYDVKKNAIYLSIREYYLIVFKPVPIRIEIRNLAARGCAIIITKYCVIITLCDSVFIIFQTDKKMELVYGL